MKILLASILVFAYTSFHSLQFADIDGNSLSMNQYAGKKILVVNIATGSSRIDQLSGLEELYRKYSDSLVIIAFPSNSFSHEAKTNAEIKHFCQVNYGITFPLASKNPITWPETQSVYHWLTTIGENGQTSEAVKGDFQKFLINQHGELIGIFSPSLEPMSAQIRNAIEN
jgi:glutathione peroxidase